MLQSRKREWTLGRQISSCQYDGRFDNKDFTAPEMLGLKVVNSKENLPF